MSEWTVSLQMSRGPLHSKLYALIQSFIFTECLLYTRWALDTERTRKILKECNLFSSQELPWKHHVRPGLPRVGLGSHRCPQIRGWETVASEPPPATSCFFKQSFTGTEPLICLHLVCSCFHAKITWNAYLTIFKKVLPIPALNHKLGTICYILHLPGNTCNVR